MAAAHRRESDRPRAKLRTAPDYAVVAVCGVLVAACMVLTTSAMPAEVQMPPEEAAPASQPEPQAQQADVAEGEVIGSYQAISQSTNADRAENLRLAAGAIDGVVIQPGETFSFNDHVGDVEQDSRYRAAPVIVGGETVEGAGGGICQVSTALYIAALKADLEIVERHPHSIASDYAPVGLDATLVTAPWICESRTRAKTPCASRPWRSARRWRFPSSVSLWKRARPSMRRRRLSTSTSTTTATSIMWRSRIASTISTGWCSTGT